MRSFVLIGFAALFGLMLASFGAAPGNAQPAQCATVQVERIRLASFDTLYPDGRRAERMTRAELSGVTQATDCGDPDYLMVNTTAGMRLVRRPVVALRSAALPPCNCDQIASIGSRNASSSGVGGTMCDDSHCGR